MSNACIHASKVGANAPATASSKTFTVTIADTVFYSATIQAATAEEADQKAWEFFESDDRDIHFTDRSETSSDIEEVEP